MQSTIYVKLANGASVDDLRSHLQVYPQLASAALNSLCTPVAYLDQLSSSTGVLLIDLTGGFAQLCDTSWCQAIGCAGLGRLVLTAHVEHRAISAAVARHQCFWMSCAVVMPDL